MDEKYKKYILHHRDELDSWRKILPFDFPQINDIPCWMTYDRYENWTLIMSFFCACYYPDFRTFFQRIFDFYLNTILNLYDTDDILVVLYKRAIKQMQYTLTILEQEQKQLQRRFLEDPKFEENFELTAEEKLFWEEPAKEYEEDDEETKLPPYPYWGDPNTFEYIIMPNTKKKRCC